MDIWGNYDATTAIIIQLGAAIGALVTIIMVIRRVHRWLQIRYASLEWMFTEEHDHNQIKSSLKDIANTLSENGRSHDFLAAYMRSSLHAHSKAVFETDQTGAITHVNRAYAQLLGVSESELTGWGWVNRIQQEHRDRIVKAWTDAVKNNRNFEGDVPYVRGDDSKFIAHAMAYKIQNGDKVTHGYLGEVTPLELKE